MWLNMETVRKLRFMLLLLSMVLLGQCSSMQIANSTAQNKETSLVNPTTHTSTLNDTTSSKISPNDTTLSYTGVVFRDKKGRQQGGGNAGGVGGGSGGGGGGGGFAWGWGGGGGGGGGGAGGWGWGGGGAGSWKWAPCGRGRRRGGNRRHHNNKGDYKVGEYAQCMGESRCKWKRLDCPLHCGGACFYDCIHMCKAHCRR